MADYEIIYSEPASADLDRLPAKHATQIVKKIGRLQSGLHGDIKRLQQHDVSYRLRMGDLSHLVRCRWEAYHRAQNQRPERRLWLRLF